MIRGRIVALAILAVLACPTAPAAGVARDGQLVMGTVLTVTVVLEDPARARELASAAIDEARRWDDALTIWRPDGELARFNRNAGTGEIPVGPRLAAGLAAMSRLEAATGGAFQPLVASFSVSPPPPRPLPRLADVLRARETRAALERGYALDPGAIGKGLALDAVVGLLRGRGVASAFLDFGGSSQSAIGGSPGDAAGWPVAVSGWAAGTVHGVVKLRDAALSTSRAGAADTTAVLDPRSGEAIAAPRLATVLAPSATSADAWSTALVVLGREGLGLAGQQGLQALVEDAAGAAGTDGFPVRTGSAPDRGADPVR